MSSQLREFAVKGLQEVRTVVHDLKPEQLTKQQLTVALEEFIYETKQHSGVEFVFRQNKPTFQLTKEQELTILEECKRQQQMRFVMEKRLKLRY